MLARLCVVGLDGVSPNVVELLQKQNLISALSRAVYNGIWREIDSLVPPLSAGSWLSIATGLSPGHTGVIDFVHKHGEFVNSNFYRGRAVWDYLSALGLRIAVIEYPMTAPPYPINGVMICSWMGSPKTYPQELETLLSKYIGRKYMEFEDKHPGDSLESVVEFALKILEHLDKAFSYIVNLEEWDLLIDVVVVTDWILHRAWHILDPRHPMHSHIADHNCKALIKEFWSFIDTYIERHLENCDTLIIVSDHGFGPCLRIERISRILSRLGLELVDIAMTKNVPYPAALVCIDSYDRIELARSRAEDLGLNIIELHKVYPGPRAHELPSIAIYDPSWVTAFVYGDPKHWYSGMHTPRALLAIRSTTTSIDAYRYVSNCRSILDVRRVIESIALEIRRYNRN